MKAKEISIYCDGACQENGKPTAKGGWAFVVVDDGKIIYKEFGKLRKGMQTNNRAEIEAFLQSLLYIRSNSNAHYTIYCDSEVVVNSVIGMCKRNLNRDLWIDVEYMCNKLLGKFTPVLQKGKINEYNIYADRLAKMGANSLLLIPTKALLKKEMSV